MASPSNKELGRIEKLRENLRDLDLCEEVLRNANLIRWLRARNLNVKDAEQMFRNYIKWFDEMKLDTIFEHEVPKEVSEVAIQPICGYDYNGNPINLTPLGKLDLAKLMKDGYKQEYMLHNIQLAERNAHVLRSVMNKRKNECLPRFSTIADMEGLSWGQLASTDGIHCMISMAKIIEAYYPETIHKIIVINAPRTFTIFWGMIKPFVSERTLEKIQIYGFDRQEWEAALLKLAPKESLPKKFGGVLPDDVDILPKPNECIPKKRGNF